MKKYALFMVIFLSLAIAGCGKNPVFSALPEVAGGSSSGETVTATARWAYYIAKPVAFAWDSGAVLVALDDKDGINANGSGDWMFMYASASKTAYIWIEVDQHTGSGKIVTEIIGPGWETSAALNGYNWEKNSDNWINSIGALDPNFTGGKIVIDTGVPAATTFKLIMSSAGSAKKYQVQLVPAYNVSEY